MAKNPNIVGGYKPRAELTYHPDMYDYATLKTVEPLTEKQMRAEYSRLRSIARKRLERMGKSEFNDTKTFTKNNGQFVPVKELTTDELMHKLSDVARFIQSKRSTVKGLKEERKKTIETLHDNGYLFVNKSNFKAFTDFMDDTRIEAQNKNYDSARIAEIFKTAEQKNIPPDEISKNFDEWYNKRELMKNIPKIDTKDLTSSERYLKALELLKVL